MAEMEQTVEIEDPEVARLLFGLQDRILRRLREAFAVQIAARGQTLRLEGAAEKVRLASEAVDRLRRIAGEQGRLLPSEVDLVIDTLDRGAALAPDRESDIQLTDRVIQARTAGQAEYVRAMRRHDVVFCVGPAGTGKTYLAVAMALSSLRSGRSKKIILARPAVEAGEKLGFLPGDLEAKVNPYLRPLYDALHDMLEFGQIRRYLENDLIEVIPLAFMRGRTLNDSFVILDEAQNTTVKQMKMVLTRLGVKSKMIVTGDVTQIDLPPEETSGLVHAGEVLRGIEGVGFARLVERDIVRHRLVQEIVQAYARAEEGPTPRPPGTREGGRNGATR
jgi:phosphate starvation-inducible PhoH-like protein